jgi:hypothetical protein
MADQSLMESWSAELWRMPIFPVPLARIWGKVLGHLRCVPENRPQRACCLWRGRGSQIRSLAVAPILLDLKTSPELVLSNRAELDMFITPSHLTRSAQLAAVWDATIRILPDPYLPQARTRLIGGL